MKYAARLSESAFGFANHVFFKRIGVFVKIVAPTLRVYAVRMLAQGLDSVGGSGTAAMTPCLSSIL